MSNPTCLAAAVKVSGTCKESLMLSHLSQQQWRNSWSCSIQGQTLCKAAQEGNAKETESAKLQKSIFLIPIKNTDQVSGCDGLDVGDMESWLNLHGPEKLKVNRLIHDVGDCEWANKPRS